MQLVAKVDIIEQLHIHASRMTAAHEILEVLKSFSRNGPFISNLLIALIIKRKDLISGSSSFEGLVKKGGVAVPKLQPADSRFLGRNPPLA